MNSGQNKMDPVKYWPKLEADVRTVGIYHEHTRRVIISLQTFFFPFSPKSQLLWTQCSLASIHRALIHQHQTFKSI